MTSRANASPPEALRADELIEHAPYLEHLSRALAADEHAASDLVQETWSRALERPPRHGANPRAWLAQILRRTHWRWSRRAREERVHEDLAETRDPGAALERVDVHATISGALDELEPPARQILQLRYFEDLPPRVIAARLAVPVSTVNTRLQRALGQLRARLDRRFGRGTWLGALFGHSLRIDGGEPFSVPASSPSSVAREGGKRALVPSARLAAGFLALVGVTWVTIALVRPDGRVTEGAAPADEPLVAAEPRVPAGFATSEGSSARRALETSGEVEAVETTPPVPRLAVLVVDPDGRPVAEAAISSFDGGTWPGRVIPLGKSDERGRFELDVRAELLTPETDPLLGGRIGLRADSPAWTPAAMHYVLPESGELTLVLGPAGRTVRGRTVDAKGEAVEGARVESGEYTTLSERDGALIGAIPLVEHTTADGRFTLQQVPLGLERLRVSAAGFATEVLYAPDDPDAPFEIVLARSGHVAGQVLGVDGQPVPGAAVWVHDPGDAWDPTPVCADDYGAFVLEGVPPGDCYVFARHPLRPKEVASQRVTVASGEETLWLPTLAVRAPLAIEVADERGQPLSDWLVNFASEDGLWLDGAATDEEGRLFLVDLPEGNLTLSVFGPRLELGRVTAARVSSSGVTRADSPVRIVVPDAAAPSATITGRLVDADDGPASSARIKIRRATESGEGAVGIDVHTGNFTTSPIPPDAWLLRADVAQLGSVDLGRHELEANEVLDLGRVTLPRPGTLNLTWTALRGDRVVVRHLVHGRWFRARVLREPPSHPIPLVPGEVQIEIRRRGAVRQDTVNLASGGEVEVDLDSLLEN